MAEYMVTGPDGSKYKVTGPEGATDEQVLAQVKAYSPEKATMDRDMPGQLGRLAVKAKTAAQRAIGQMDPDVDYTGLDNPKIQAAYSLIDKPEDKTAYLKETFGEKNVTKDSFGRDVVIQDGKKLAVAPREDSTKYAATIASKAGEVLPLAGMIAGGIAGAGITTPLGGSGAIPGAAAGGAAGTAYNKVLAKILGLPSTETTPETARDILAGGATGAAAETIGAGARFLGRSAMGPYKEGSVFGPWERTKGLYREQMADVEAARQYGMRPKVGTFAPNAPFVQRVQQAGMRVFGDELANINRPILEKNIQELTTKAGEGAVPAADIGKAVTRKTDIAVQRAEFGAETAKKDAESELLKAQDSLTKSIGTPTGKLSKSVEEDIRTSRANFGSKASDLYAPLDAMAGKPIAPTAPIKETLRGILKEMPPTRSGKVSVLVPENLQAFAKGIEDLPDYVTLQQMQAIRSKFYSSSDVAALNAGLSDRQAIRLARAADSSFDATAQGPFAGSKEAIDALRKADRFYKAGIKRYEDMSVQALVRDATETGFVQPEKVARYIATPGQTDKLLRIKKVVSPDTFREVGSETWTRMVNDSQDSLTGQLNAKTLSNQIKNMGKSLDVLYGKDAPQIRALAEQWGALDGKVPIEGIPSGNVRNILQAAVDSQKKMDTLVKSDWVKAIRTDGPQSLRAADYLTNPENRLQIRKALQTFGPDSGEGKGLKEYLARRIFSTMEQPASKGAEKYGKTELMGAPLQQELDRYGKEYLNEVMGKDWTNSAYRFAKAAEVATRKNPSDSGAIVVAFLALHPLSHIWMLGKLFAGTEILSSDAAITYMTLGIEGGGANFIKSVGDLASHTIPAYEAEKINKSDYTSAARYKARGELERTNR